jgi:hypothetical protein
VFQGWRWEFHARFGPQPLRLGLLLTTCNHLGRQHFAPACAALEWPEAKGVVWSHQ